MLNFMKNSHTTSHTGCAIWHCWICIFKGLFWLLSGKQIGGEQEWNEGTQLGGYCSVTVDGKLITTPSGDSEERGLVGRRQETDGTNHGDAGLGPDHQAHRYRSTASSGDHGLLQFTPCSVNGLHGNAAEFGWRFEWCYKQRLTHTSIQLKKVRCKVGMSSGNQIPREDRHQEPRKDIALHRLGSSVPHEVWVCGWTWKGSFLCWRETCTSYLCLGTGIGKDLETEGAVISQPLGCFQLCSVLSSLRKPSTPFLSPSKHSWKLFC